MKRLTLALLLGLIGAGVGSLSLGAVATATTPKLGEIPNSYLLSGLPPPAPRIHGSLKPLRAGLRYQASTFPLALRLTPPDGGWTGAQWKSARLGFRGGGPPYFGWVAVGRGGTRYMDYPRGLIVITTADARTPSVAKTVARLRTHGRWATYEATTPVKVAGFSGVQFDGQVASGRIHVFAPFSDANHFQDAFFAGGSEAFRVIVLDVRGKTVVVFIDGVGLFTDEFPAFLTRADQVLKSLKFPAETKGG